LRNQRKLLQYNDNIEIPGIEVLTRGTRRGIARGPYRKKPLNGENSQGCKQQNFDKKSRDFRDIIPDRFDDEISDNFDEDVNKNNSQTFLENDL
jgi:hypothetical protein